MSSSCHYLKPAAWLFYSRDLKPPPHNAALGCTPDSLLRFPTMQAIAASAAQKPTPFETHAIHDFPHWLSACLMP